MTDRDRPTRAEGDAGGFLRRWSRRKAEARSAPAATAPAAREDASPAAKAAPASPQEAHEPDAPIDPKDLPDIASLDASSDFTVFMRTGVPAHLRTLALRKLWQADPIFSKLDGLVEYGEDYSIASWPKGTIATAYRVGRGIVNELETLETVEAEPAPPEPVGGPAPQPGPAGAATVEAPADSPAELPQPMPEPAGSNEARPAPRRPAPERTEAGVAAKRRRPLPRRG